MPDDSVLHDPATSPRIDYADLFESAPIGYLLLAPDGRIARCNQTASQLMGFVRGAPADSFASFVRDDERSRWENYLASLFDSGERMSIELALQRPGGPVFQARLDGFCKDDSDDAAPVRLTISDIDDSKQAEAALREREARFRFIIDKSPGLIWVTDTEAQCSWFNKTWLAFTGRSIHQELGRGWAEGVHPDDAAASHALVERAFAAREPFAVEYRLRRHDGVYRWMLGIGQPRFDTGGNFNGYVGTCLDITGRKRMELEKEQLLAFFRLSLDLMCVVGHDGRIQKVNAAFSKETGYSEEELLNKPFIDLAVDSDRALVDTELTMMQRVTGNHTLESQIRRKGGDTRQISWKVCSTPERSVLYITGRDTTDFQASEDQLRKLGLAVQQSSHSIVISDLSGRVEYVNEAACKISGYSADELIGRNQRMLSSGQTPQTTYDEMWTTLTRGDVWQGELINVRKNGEIFIESARISLLRQPDGWITHYLAIKEDITEHKRAMDAIRESKTLLQGVIDAIPDWIYVKDANHRFILVNEQCARAIDQTPASMVGRVDSDFIPSSLSVGAPDDAITSIHADDNAVFSGIPVHRPTDKVVYPDGRFGIFDTYKTPMRDASQRVTGSLCYRRDITDRYNRQQEQELLENQLRQAQKMELIGHLAGGIAHDFNNILAAVFGYAELMQMAPEVENNAELTMYVGEILQAGIRAKELVAQLLTFSQRREAASEAISVAPIVKEVSKLLRSTMPSSISINSDLDEALPEALISAVQLHQVLMNLAVNARDAISGAGTIDIRATQTTLTGSHICASCHQNFGGHHLLISVRDSGSGIAADKLSRIFDPFFTTKEVGRGSGLGLSVLHGIVHSAKGHVEVTTRRGHGTEFRVYLPTHTREQIIVPTASEPPAGASALYGRVMVVDDEASIVRLTTLLLENLGCRVIGTTSAAEALRIFENDPHCVDLVLTDQTMPELSGAELARAMLACRADIPIVLSTGYSNVIDEDKVRQIGIRRLLMKPVPAKILADIVTEYLVTGAARATRPSR